jgi:hypothetical protein
MENAAIQARTLPFVVEMQLETVSDAGTASYARRERMRDNTPHLVAAQSCFKIAHAIAGLV